MGAARHSWWERISDAGRRVEDFLIAALLTGLILFSSAQIVLRNVFSIGFTWGDGLVRLLVLWLALLGALAASRDGRHITLGTLTRWLPAPLHAATGAIAQLFAAAVTAALAWYSLAFVLDSKEYGDVLLGDVPAWMLQSIMPVVFALIAARFLLRAVTMAFAGAPQAEER